MTDDSFHCRLCESEEGHVFYCEECSNIFCSEHIAEADHYCGAAVYHSELPNGSTYAFPLTGLQKRLVKRTSAFDSMFGSVTSMLLASPTTLGLVLLLWAWFPIQFGTLASMGVERQQEWAMIFGLHPDNIWNVSRWVISILSHGGLGHLAINSFVLAMFGPFAEQRLGSRRFLLFFFGSGVIAGLLQVGIAALVGATMLPIMGASGAIAGVICLLATVEPDLRVYFLFVFPMSLGVMAGGLIIISYLVPAVFGVGVLGIAHLAHAGGGTVGVLYGWSRTPQSIVGNLREVVVAGMKKFP